MLSKAEKLPKDEIRENIKVISEEPELKVKNDIKYEKPLWNGNHQKVLKGNQISADKDNITNIPKSTSYAANNNTIEKQRWKLAMLKKTQRELKKRIETHYTT